MLDDRSSRLAFVFPGQGSQSPGMLADYFEHSAIFRQCFEESSEALGFDLWALVASGDQHSLSLTANTQPVLLTSSVAIYRVFENATAVRPSFLAGHSLGEFSALTAAHTFTLTDAVRLVRKRGELMQAAVPEGVGAMAAVIGLDDDSISSLCREVSATAGEVVEAVNFNAPGQVVIAGVKEAVATASEALKQAGAKRVLPLPVSAPFHTSLMQPAAQALRVALEGISLQMPTIPVIHNVTAAAASEPSTILDLLVTQLYSPVRWTQCVNAMAAAGVLTIVECGPGKVLSGLTKRIDPSLNSESLSTFDGLLRYTESLEVNL